MIASHIASPAIAEHETVNVAFIIPDHAFTPRQIDLYTNQALTTLAEVFDGTHPYVVPDPNPQFAQGELTPIVVAVKVERTNVQERQLNQLGAWATQVSDQTALPEVGIVIGDYYYPFKTTESTI